MESKSAVTGRDIDWDGVNFIFDPQRRPTIPANNGRVVVEYTLDGSEIILELDTIIIDELINEAHNNTVSFNVSGLLNVTETTIPTDALEQFVDADLSMAIRLPQGSITLDAKALASVSNQAKGDDVSISIAQVEHINLNEDQQNALSANDVVFSIKMLSDEEFISRFDGGRLTITVPYEGELPATIWYLNSAGVKEKHSIVRTDMFRNVSFTVEHLSFYVIGHDSETIEPPEEFSGTSPSQLNAALSKGDVMLTTPGSGGYGIAAGSTLVIPEGKTLYVSTILNVRRDATLRIEGTLVVLPGGRLNSDGHATSGTGTIVITNSGELINEGYVEIAQRSKLTNLGTITNTGATGNFGRFEIRAGVEFTRGTTGGNRALNIHRDAVILVIE